MSTLKERLDGLPPARRRKIERRYRRLKAEQMKLDELRRPKAVLKKLAPQH